jgi:FemAB-related protein (PEP-CTERM system-associated)
MFFPMKIMETSCADPQRSGIAIHRCEAADIPRHLERWQDYIHTYDEIPLSRHPSWLLVLQRGLQHAPYCLEAREGQRIRGLLPLAYVKSLFFGRFLVSLPYLNYGGVLSDNDTVTRRLLDGAAQLADELGVRYLEIRHESAVRHDVLNHCSNHKVNMRLPLPSSAEQLRKQLNGKVRNQVVKAERSDLKVVWGRHELLPDFYAIFSQHMRDLGTPVYSRRLFQSILDHFPDEAEICLVRAGTQAAGAALLLHGRGITEVPSASTLRAFHHTCANMLMYWHLLTRTVERGQRIFDFGRCSPESNTFRFKKQWGAKPHAANWQYYVRRGEISEMRADHPKYQRFIRIWQQLPVPLTRWIGPAIVRGIP